jgi:hypothetical protein
MSFGEESGEKTVQKWKPPQVKRYAEDYPQGARLAWPTIPILRSEMLAPSRFGTVAMKLGGVSLVRFEDDELIISDPLELIPGQVCDERLEHPPEPRCV